ncbi:MAG: clostripain-related cysteine peptidase [Anaerolineae bacterium]
MKGAPLAFAALASVLLMSALASDLSAARPNEAIASPTAGAAGRWRLLEFDHVGVGDISFSPTYSLDRTIVAVTSDGLFRSLDGGVTWAAPDVAPLAPPGALFYSPAYRDDHLLFATTIDGVLRSNDGGATWRRAGLKDIRTIDLAMSPDYATDGSLFVTAENGSVYRSADGGEHWDVSKPVATGDDIRSVVISPEYPRDRTLFISTVTGVYRSVDGGKTWETANTGLVSADASDLSISPDFARDHTLFVAIWNEGVFRSNDGGASWRAANEGQLNRSLGCFTLSPNYASDHTVYLTTWGGSFGGVYRSVDGGDHWDRFSDGLPRRILGCVSIWPTPAQPTLVVGAHRQDEGGLWMYAPPSENPLPPTPTPTPSPPKPWTFMFYVDGDNNLYRPLAQALRELEALPANPDANVVVLFDGDRRDDTVRLLVQPNGLYTNGVNRWLLDEADMGDPTTLADFVRWSRTAYPAQHYYLSIADHGRGTQGVAWDMTSRGDYLTPHEVAAALASTTEGGRTKLDIVHYDTCLMAMVEDAYDIAPYADYLIAMQNLGWSAFGFDRYVSAAGPPGADVGPRELARRIAGAYFRRPELLGQPRAISVLDMAKIDSLRQALDRLSQALRASMPAAGPTIRAARNRAQTFDSRGAYRLRPDDEYVDVYDLAVVLSAGLTDSELQAAVQAVIEAVNTVVVLERHESGVFGEEDNYWNLDDAHGVSIYFPLSQASVYYSPYVMGRLFQFTTDSQWDEFLTLFLGPPSGTPIPLAPSDVPPMPTPPARLYLPWIQVAG